MTAAQIGEALIPWIPAIVALIAAFVALTNRNRDSNDRKSGSWTELANENRNLRGEMDTLRDDFDEFRKEVAEFKAGVDRKDRAYANVLSDAANQWPKDHEGPMFNPDDIDVIGDTMPPFFRRARPLFSEPPRPRGSPR